MGRGGDPYGTPIHIVSPSPILPLSHSRNKTGPTQRKLAAMLRIAGDWRNVARGYCISYPQLPLPLGEGRGEGA